MQSQDNEVRDDKSEMNSVGMTKFVWGPTAGSGC